MRGVRELELISRAEGWICAVARSLAARGWSGLSRPARVILAGAGVVIALVSVGASSAPACGCGVLLGASEVSEQALVSSYEGVETIVPGLTIDRVGARAAVVFPVPASPRVRALPANVDVFGELDTATTQPVSEPDEAPGFSGALAPPRVVSARLIGGYRVTVLRGGSGQTLLAWLRSHKYGLPAAAKPILSVYIAQRWYFVAIRLASRDTGEVKPLAIAFRFPRIVYPMRLSRAASDRVSLELFVDADGPAQGSGISGLRTTFGGAVSALAPAPSAAVRSLLPAPYLTRIDADSVPPASISSDIVVRIARRGAAAPPPRASTSDAWRYVAIALIAVAACLGVAYLMSRRHRASPGATG
jgi:Uncharacterized protein conserved in bacteria (DUF2330)